MVHYICFLGRACNPCWALCCFSWTATSTQPHNLSYSYLLCHYFCGCSMVITWASLICNDAPCRMWPTHTDGEWRKFAHCSYSQRGDISLCQSAFSLAYAVKPCIMCTSWVQASWYNSAYTLLFWPAASISIPLCPSLWHSLGLPQLCQCT